MRSLKLRIITPRGTVAELECGSVRLTVRDGESGKGGGSYGIHPGHLKAVYLLGSGEVVALSEGREVGRYAVDGGFASVEKDVIIVMSE